MHPILYIAKRYAFSKSKTKAINIITAISSMGIIVSTMALFVVLSVFSGLEEYTKSFTNALDPDYVAVPQKGKFFQMTPNELNAIQSIEGVNYVSEIIEERVVFTYNNKQSVALLKAVPQGYDEHSGLIEYTENGRWAEPHTAQVVVGKALLYELGIGQYSETSVLEALAMKPGEGLFSSPEDAYNRIPLYAIDVYSFNNIETDKKYIYSDLEVGQELLSWPKNQYTKLELLLDTSANETQVLQQIEQLHPNTFTFKSRAQLNDSLYKMLQTESLAVYLVFTLIIIITLFCLCGAIIMIILEKKADIRTLSHIGFTLSQIKNIFFTQGMIITIIGSLVGLILGICIAFAQQKWQWIMINEDFAYPILFKAENISTVLLTILTLGTLSCWVSSSRINKNYTK